MFVHNCYQSNAHWTLNGKSPHLLLAAHQTPFKKRHLQLMLGSTAWAQINTVSLAAGQVNSDKTLQYFNIYGHKCVDLHSFTLPCNFHDCNYNTKQRPKAIHVLFTQHAAHDTGPKIGYAMRVTAVLPTHTLQCYQHTNSNATNTQTYLHSLSRFSQSRPSNKHCGLLHSMSHSPSMNTFQQLMGAEQLRHGLIPSEQSLPSKLHAYELHSSSHCELPDFSLHPLAAHFARCSSKSESIAEIVLVGIRLGLGTTGWPHPARKLGL